MKLRSSFAIICAGSAVFAQAQFQPGLREVPSDLKKGFDTIKPADGKNFLTFLSTQCEGRGTGQPGFQKAMDYMAAHFKQYGLKPIMPDGSYFQLVDFWRVGTDPKSLHLETSHYKAKESEIGVARNGTVDVQGDVIFVSANGDITKVPDEVKDAVKGKIVLISNTSKLRNFENLLMGADAKTVISIVDKVPSPSWSGSNREPSASTTIARLSISKKSVAKMFGAEDMKIINAATQPNTIFSMPLTEKITAGAKPIVEKIKVGNVVAKLEGSDPALANEYIGVGAHLDHLGKRGDVVYPGADDDGSGSTALLQLAKALTSNPVKPKRTVIFMSFFGEEMGLLGSRYFSDNPPVDIKNKMIAELQMDMVGRNSVGAQNGDQNRIDKEDENRDTIRLVGSKRISTGLDKIILDQNESIGWKFRYDAEDVYTRSDHYNFARLGIPIAFFFTGFHPDYHQPTDTIEKINFDKISNTAKLVYLCIHQLGNYQGMLPHDVQQSGGGR